MLVSMHRNDKYTGTKKTQKAFAPPNARAFKILHFQFEIISNIFREARRVCAFLLSCTRLRAARHLCGLIDCAQHMRWPVVAIRRQKVIVLHQPCAGDTDTCVSENAAQLVKERRSEQNQLRSYIWDHDIRARREKSILSSPIGSSIKC